MGLSSFVTGRASSVMEGLENSEAHVWPRHWDAYYAQGGGGRS